MDGHISLQERPALDRWFTKRRTQPTTDGRSTMLNTMYAKCRRVQPVYRPQISMSELLGAKPQKQIPSRAPSIATPVSTRPPTPEEPELPAEIAMREFLHERANRGAQDKANDVKKLAYAQHRLGMKRWEMARDHELEKELAVRFPWIDLDPPTPPPDEELTPRELEKAKSRRASIRSMLSLDLPESSTPSSARSDPEEVPTRVPGVHRNMRHPTCVTPAPWIVATYQQGKEEQLLLQQETELYLASLAVDEQKAVLLQAPSNVKTALNEFNKLPVEQQISPLKKLAEAECNVAKKKASIFEIPIQGPMRVGKEFIMNKHFNPLRPRGPTNARHLPKPVTAPGFYTKKDPRWAAPYKFNAPKYKVPSVEVSNKIG